MKSKYGFIDPGAIMGVVVSLIILSVGVFAFFVTLGQIQNQNSLSNSIDYATQNATHNISSTGDSVFNIIGIVLVIGAIMAIVGLVCNYVR